jgi:hypothetical protein
MARPTYHRLSTMQMLDIKASSGDAAAMRPLN